MSGKRRLESFEKTNEFVTGQVNGNKFALLQQACTVGPDGIGRHLSGLFKGASFGVTTWQDWHRDPVLALGLTFNVHLGAREPGWLHPSEAKRN